MQHQLIPTLNGWESVHHSAAHSSALSVRQKPQSALKKVMAEPMKRRCCRACRDEGHYTPPCPNKSSEIAVSRMTGMMIHITRQRNASFVKRTIMCAISKSFIWRLNLSLRAPTPPTADKPTDGTFSDNLYRRFRRLFLSFKVSDKTS